MPIGPPGRPATSAPVCSGLTITSRSSEPDVALGGPSSSGSAKDEVERIHSTTTPPSNTSCSDHARGLRSLGTERVHDRSEGPGGEASPIAETASGQAATGYARRELRLRHPPESLRDTLDALLIRPHRALRPRHPELWPTRRKVPRQVRVRPASATSRSSSLDRSCPHRGRQPRHVQQAHVPRGTLRAWRCPPSGRRAVHRDRPDVCPAAAPITELKNMIGVNVVTSTRSPPVASSPSCCLKALKRFRRPVDPVADHRQQDAGGLDQPVTAPMGSKTNGLIDLPGKRDTPEMLVRSWPRRCTGRHASMRAPTSGTRWVQLVSVSLRIRPVCGMP